MKTLFIAWQDFSSHAWFPVGRLTFDGNCYYFVYLQGAIAAQEQYNFPGLWSFSDFHKVYESTEILPLLSHRIMPRSRPDYSDFMQWLNLPENFDDPIALLSRSGGKKATDHFEVFPCPEPDEKGLYHIHFFASNIRCLPSPTAERIASLYPKETLRLARDLENHHDPQALLLLTADCMRVGYCPRYLFGDPLKLLRQGSEKVQVVVEQINPPPAPIQFRLLCHLTGYWEENFHPFASKMYEPLAVDYKSS